MNVLHVVTSSAPFFEDQIEGLEAQGVNCTTLEVPSADGPLSTMDAYRRCYQQVLRAGLDDYDVVHANYGLVGPLALAQPTRPVVLTLWGSEVMGDSDRLTRISRFAAQHSDAVIVPSEPISREFALPHQVVPFPVDTDTFRPIPQEAARSAVDWSPDETVVLFPYHPDRSVKNYPRAKRVVAAVNDRIEESVELRWIWGVPHEEVPLYLNAADAVLITSDHESGPMVVKEAAACNVPVVSTPVGFAAGTLDGVSNSTVKITDAGLVEAMVAVLENGNRSNGRSTIRAPDVEWVGTRLAGIYRDVLDS